MAAVIRIDRQADATQAGVSAYYKAMRLVSKAERLSSPGGLTTRPPRLLFDGGLVSF